MYPLNITSIEREARKLRSEELQRIQGVMWARMGVYFRLLAASGKAALNVISKSVRPLFSWNPQDAAPSHRADGPSLFTRASLTLRTLFSWNPQAHRY
jgi:hypothetical protein